MQKREGTNVATSNELEGKTILITRRAEQADEFIAEIELRGGRAVIIPLIQISGPESWAACDAALENLPAYAGIVFTSGNSVEYFFGRLGEKQMRLPAKLAIYAVGMRTAGAIKEKGGEVDYVPAEFSSAALIDFLSRQKIQGKKFLLPGGNLNSTQLESALTRQGASADCVEVYRNTLPDQSTIHDLMERFARNEFDVITFASSSAVNNFAQIIPSPYNKTKFAVIGPSTKETAQALNLPIDIEANESTSRGLVKAISEFYSNRKN